MKGHMQDGKFHPHTEYKKGTRKSRDQQVKSQGVKIRKKKVFSQKRMQTALENFLSDPQIAGTADEFHGCKETGRGLWLSGEEGNLIDGISAFDYYGYDGGVNPEMRKWLDERGWYAEWNDAGTVMLVKQ